MSQTLEITLRLIGLTAFLLAVVMMANRWRRLRDADRQRAEDELRRE
jgi:hypothetical protein